MLFRSTVPTTQDELVTLDRITPQFASKYGNVFLQLIQLFLDTNGITLQTPFVSRGLLRRKQQEAFRREFGGKNRLEEASRQVMQGIGKETKDMNGTNSAKDINHEDTILDEDWYGNDDEWLKVAEEAEKMEGSLLQNPSELPSSNQSNPSGVKVNPSSVEVNSSSVKVNPSQPSSSEVLLPPAHSTMNVSPSKSSDISFQSKRVNVTTPSNSNQSKYFIQANTSPFLNRSLRQMVGQKIAQPSPTKINPS